MEKNEIGKFYAISFNEDIELEFIVHDDNTIDCPALELHGYNHMALNPRFKLFDYKRDEKGHVCAIRSYVYDVKSKNKGENSLDLINMYSIEDPLFDYLYDNKMISYSNEMAVFYGFKMNRQDGPKPFKRAIKKGPILVKQRQGQLN